MTFLTLSSSGLVRARGLKHIDSFFKRNGIVRARKSPWIETTTSNVSVSVLSVRARKSPWIETNQTYTQVVARSSGLVRARGLKLTTLWKSLSFPVRARKSPWIETICGLL